MKILKGLTPEKVFEYFEAISAIPRGSGYNDKIKEFTDGKQIVKVIVVKGRLVNIVVK